MPRDKDLKRLVRARMRRTGESYTAARAHIIRKPRTSARTTLAAGTAAAPTPTPAPTAYAALAGTSDATLKRATGCNWERWVRSLDHHGAREMSHRDIAALVKAKYKVDGWWSQTVAVGYERIRGLRARGQQRDGTFEATKSRTFNVPIARLFAAWADAATRRRWMDGAKVRVRTATPPKSMRLDWDSDGIVAVGFFAKGSAKSYVALSHAKLPDRESAAKLKQYWSDRLDVLGALLHADE